jgi:hypothetical protein
MILMANKERMANICIFEEKINPIFLVFYVFLEN